MKRLREILKDQIDWYKKNKHDPDFVYDCLIDEFSSLTRGDYVDLIEEILKDD